MELKNLLDESKKYLQNKDKTYANNLLNTALSTNVEGYEKSFWSEFLNVTYMPDFLELLPDENARNQWAEKSLEIIRKTNFNLLDMFSQRTSRHPEKVLFRQVTEGNSIDWTYEKIFSYTKEIAAAILAISDGTPKVAIFSENSVPSASADLACLFYDILVSPLNVNFNMNEVQSIFETLNINIVFTDTEERYKKLFDLRNDTSLDFKIICTKADCTKNSKDLFLGSYLRSLDGDKIDDLIERRPKFRINEVATVMFTSGSTGKPKGISFSVYNLISKRYCRGAALEKVGRDEVFLCYLPLFHTFGRFLEMLGTIYWNGTYVFTGNTSPETLMKLFRTVEPSVFISVPLRWMQLEDEAMKNINQVTDESQKNTAFRKATGRNLHWGLSAAGYLDPKTFRFFRKNGVELCSGFGMTEGTGGITMTPPGEYFDDSVGKPLPGIYLKLAEHNELQIKGHYVARYLDDKAPGDIIPYPDEDDYWLPTGDVFEKMENGHYKIVDRLKDIYKNNKGQTIAPRNVENKFTGVPGIKSVFLVGDGKPYNVLLIVPDKNEEILFSKSQTTIDEYYNQIIRAANDELPSYERVINYTVVERDFSQDKGELTPKGSFNRKTILENFKDVIEQLYVSNSINIKIEDLIISIPRWYFRDLSILENDIYAEENYLYNKVNKTKLHFSKSGSSEVEGYNSIIIGNFEYKVKGKKIDLGRLIRQPLLWLGNKELMEFGRYKYGWDTSFGNFYQHIFLTDFIYDNEPPQLKRNKDAMIAEIYRLNMKLFSSDKSIVINSLEILSGFLSKSDENISNLIRSRIELLARHNDEDVRATAYRILLLDEPQS
jgi:long-chain acyl-CoA synthetase